MNKKKQKEQIKRKTRKEYIRETRKTYKIGFWELFSMKSRLSPGAGRFSREKMKTNTNFGTQNFVPKFGLFGVKHRE